MADNDRERRFLVRLLQVDGIEQEIIDFMDNSARKNGDLLRRWVVLGFVLSERTKSAGAVLKTLGLGGGRKKSPGDPDAQSAGRSRPPVVEPDIATTTPQAPPAAPTINSKTKSTLTSLMGSGQ